MTNEEIAKLKSLMKQGIVKFKFQKKDGTERVAYGTMKPELCPKTDRQVKFKATDIKWDKEVDGETLDVKLPESDTVSFAESDIAGMCEDDIHTWVIDILSERHSFLIEGCKVEKVEKQPKKLAPGTIFFADKERGGYRSCNESQLLSFEDELLTEEDIPF